MNAWIKKYWLTIKTVIVRELHANTSPLRASLSLALGILVGFSPLYGLHIVIVLPLAFLLRLNRPIALLGVSTTILPVVPFWIAAGIFMGKLVIPLETAERLAHSAAGALPPDLLVRLKSTVMTSCRHVFPDRLFDAIVRESGGVLAAGFTQWVIGCCALAVASAVLTFLITYPVFLRIGAARKRGRQTA